MTITVKHSKTNSIADWTQSQLDAQIAAGNFPAGTTLANIVLPSDWNNDHTLVGVGTMAEQNANNVAITGGTAALSSVTATTNDLTLSAISTGAVKFQTSKGLSFSVSDNYATVANYYNVIGNVAGASPELQAIGASTNIDCQFLSKGTGSHRFFTQGTSYAEQVRFANTTSSVNYVQLSGGATTKAVISSSQGSDTNISMAFQSKGTGAIDLAAGSSGVNISNGGTVTAITRTAAGSGYTTNPTITISAPTTAGGVQATASSTLGYFSPTITSGGTGYTVGDVLTFSGGTFTSAGTLTVSTVSGGVITGVTGTTTGSYTAVPTSPISVTGGTGAGATFSPSWAVNSTISITNAGSGYIEQPTVTFSGGGGSGASAYATVGSGTIVKSIGSTMSFYTPGGEGFRVNDPAAGTIVNYVQATGSVTNGGVQIRPAGSDSNVPMLLSSKGTAQFGVYTNSFAQEQFRVAHTASAVNYVQVTGAATGSQATISAQGSDANVGLIYTSKGTSSLQFRTNSSTQTQLFITHTANAVNYASITGSAAGSAPVFSVAGTDTNIDLALTPKGTGLVRFGTLTANADAPITGYITIKDSAGTTRKLAVIA